MHLPPGHTSWEQNERTPVWALARLQVSLPGTSSCEAVTSEPEEVRLWLADGKCLLADEAQEAAGVTKQA